MAAGTAETLAEHLPGHGNQLAGHARADCAAGNTRRAGSAGRHCFSAGGRSVGHATRAGERQNSKLNAAALRINDQVPDMAQGLAVLRLHRRAHEIAQANGLARAHRTGAEAAGGTQAAG